MIAIRQAALRYIPVKSGDQDSHLVRGTWRLVATRREQTNGTAENICFLVPIAGDESYGRIAAYKDRR
jgi:hypothetical protein